MERELPILQDSCSLSPADLDRRLDDFRRLFQRAAVSTEERPSGARIVLRADDGVASEMRALAALESECCPFFRFQIEETGEHVVVGVSAARSEDALRELIATSRTASA